MNSFRKGRSRVMVATDIAARGIDVSQITHVINYDIPDTAEAYTHRTGRTGRMERLGMAITFVTEDDLEMVRTIERLMGQTLERRKLEGFEVNFMTTIRHNPAGQVNLKRTPGQRSEGSNPPRRPRSFVGNR